MPAPYPDSSPSSSAAGLLVDAVDSIYGPRHTKWVDAFAVVADPTRRRILEELRGRERTVNELVGDLGLNQPTVSKHLRVLRDARMVASSVDAQRRRYRIESEGLQELDEWIDAFRRLWSTRLDALEVHLDRRSR